MPCPHRAPAPPRAPPPALTPPPPLLACRAEGLTIADESRVDVFLIALGAPAKDFAVALSARLRRAGVRVDLAWGERGLKGSMKAADKSGAGWTIVVGDSDLEADSINIKNMSDGTLTKSSTHELVQTVQHLIKEKNSASHS